MKYSTIFPGAMDADLEAVVQALRDTYKQNVKPALEQHDLRAATPYFCQIISAMDTDRQRMEDQVHCGLLWLQSAHKVYDYLQQALPPPASAIKEFEAYTAQTRLPLMAGQR